MSGFLMNLTDASARMAGKPDWRVEIAKNGRDGSVNYHEPAGSMTFYWEFGGGDTVAIVSVGKAAEWKARYPWAAGRRQEILQRVARAVIRQKAPACRTDIDGQGGYICVR